MADKKEKGTAKKLKAKADFHLFCPPEIDLHIKKGDDLAKVPEKYHNNLITEGIL